MITLELITPKKSLNPAFRKEKVLREEVERFKQDLSVLFEKADPKLSEETLKNLVGHLLTQQGYAPDYHISVNKDRQDMSIHLGRNTSAAVGVIIETKRPGAPDMMSCEKPNTKALHELVLYYLRERIILHNDELKYLIATDVFNWIIIDANEFDKKIYRNTAIRKIFEIYRTDGKDNDFFYGALKDYFTQSDEQILATSFNLLQFKKVATNSLKTDDLPLLPIFKVLNPVHLLKKQFANDSNTLDKGFYAELLHLIGLEEVKDGGKKTIRRKNEGNRNEGSLLENTIQKLEDKEALRNLDSTGKVGESKDEQYFSVALELCITWVNRILFMKLLEAQLLTYQGGDKKYLFLNNQLVHDFDELNNLFFQVLAEKPESRRANVQHKFSKVPYLNSSLFDRTELERKTLEINSLDNQLSLPLPGVTVLKDAKGKRETNSPKTLEYLFRFLDAYDFASEGKADIQEENKALINASVLGLIFEKINGYKDGSFFTPGFVTMYMCAEVLRRAVVQKFNEHKGWHCQSLDDLYNKIEDRQEANDIINQLTICDPAVGSGHFLVSALNELILIKHELKILQDRAGKRLKEYKIEVVNDELIVTDDDVDPVTYRPGNPESQRVQEALFHEKQTLIENCLFGVDINPNSVKICRLRLWIELLKNAYYVPGHEKGQEPALETLPNIDINIKCGNSLVNRFGLDADLSSALAQSKWTIDTYKNAVLTYKHARNKQEKRELEDLIDKIKKDFRTDVSTYDPINKRLNKLRGEVFSLSQSNVLFGKDAVAKKRENNRLEKLSSEIVQLEKEKIEIQENKVYRDAFEWRFEFPEVLDAEGRFTGFDVVIGNPPYIRQEEISWMKEYLKRNYSTYTGTADLYVFFVERGVSLLKPGGYFAYILPNKWMKGGYGKALRIWAGKMQTEIMVDFGDLPVFDEATTYPSIWLIRRQEVEQTSFKAATVEVLNHPNGLSAYLSDRWVQVGADSLTTDSWNLVDNTLQSLLNKIKAAGKPLGEYVNGKIYYGIKTGYNEAFVIDKDTKERLIQEDSRSAELIKPFLAGKDIKRYTLPKSDRWLIFTRRGVDIESYPAIFKHLLQFKSRLEPKPKDWQAKEWPGRKEGTYKWFEIQDAVDYYDEFEKPKILYQEIAAYSTFTFDKSGIYTNNKLFLIPSTNMSLLGFLNSKLVWFYLKNTANILRGALALQSPYILGLPFADAIEGNAEIKGAVEEIILLRLENKNADALPFERIIDQKIFEIYNLNAEEIELVTNIK